MDDPIDRKRIIRVLDACEITDAMLMKATGCDRKRLREIISGESAATADEAKELQRYLGINSAWWLALTKSKD